MGTFSDLRLSFRRATLLVAVLCAAIVPAQAGAESIVQFSTPFSAVVFNPCAGEFVFVEGNLHVQSHMSGDVVRTYFNSQDLKGFSIADPPDPPDPPDLTPTGAQYVAQSIEHTVVDAPPGTSGETYRRDHLVRKGEEGTFLEDDDDFQLVTRIQFTVQLVGPPIIDSIEVSTDPCH
jgi:hypothetical protein